MTIGERIKYLRKDVLSLTQENFSKEIKISRSNLGSIEINRVNVTDRVVIDICSSFNINEIWLRTGEGGDDNIFKKIEDEERYYLNLGKLSNAENKFIQNAINYFAETEPEKLKVVEEFMKKCLGIEKETN